MYCPDYYWNTIELTRHRNLHSDIEYKCEICAQVFYNRDSIYSHCSAQHSNKHQKVDADKEYICDLCSKSFKTKYAVRSHLLLHISELTLPICKPNKLYHNKNKEKQIFGFFMVNLQENLVIFVRSVDGAFNRKAI